MNEQKVLEHSFPPSREPAGRELLGAKVAIAGEVENASEQKGPFFESVSEGTDSSPEREDGVRVVSAHELAALEKEPVWSLSLGLHCRSNTRSGISRRGVLRRRW